LEKIAIYGAGGFGKETRFLLESINSIQKAYSFQGYIDDFPKPGRQYAEIENISNLSIAIASPGVRKKIFQKCGSKFNYPNLIDPGLVIDPSVSMGYGLIICAGVKITVDVHLGNFIIINLNATIGHDVKIGSFSSIMPSVNISGNVTIGESVFIGTGSTILQGLTIGEGAVIGAGAVVTKNIPPQVVAKGVPARWRE
jgi:sugar O-acyltransferase (sialic acid O-acetyltransferase NeuD family)